MAGVNIKKLDENTTQFSFTNGSLDVIIRHGDLSKEACDAIVNPTNVSMNPDGGIDSIMHDVMGPFFTDQVVAIHKDRKQDSCPHGQSRIFIAKFDREENDPRFIISTVGPVYKEEEKERAAFYLTSCYYTSLALANIYQLNSIAYPAISCGANKFPPHEAARIAIDAIRNHSFNVKDVRFVLFERSIYNTFVQEWTTYAEKVNKESNYTPLYSSDSSEISKASLPTSGRFCVLCKTTELPVDRQLLCHNCSDLPRPEVFNRFLNRLRTAADKSYEDLRRTCEKLKPVLKSYPLVYNPAQIFDQSIHQRDPVAEHYIQSYTDKDTRNSVPMAILGDGNCFYNAFVKLGSAGTTTDSSSLTPVELRARNVVELVLNRNVYESQYDQLTCILDKFESYVRTEMVRNTNYAAVWDFFAIPTILNIQVVSIYPKVNGPDDLHYHYLNNMLYIPLLDETDVDDQKNKKETPTVFKEVRLLFSNCNRPLPGFAKNKSGWTPNHFVPLLRYQ